MSDDTQRDLSEVHVDSRLCDAKRSLSEHVQLLGHLLPEFDQMSIHVVDKAGNTFTYAQTGDLAADLDGLQYGSGEGPCIDILRGADLVVAPGVREDGRWGGYVRSAAELGLASQISTALQWRGGKLLGVLNMYSTTRAEIALTAPLITEALAAQVAGTLTHFSEIENLHRALATRQSIGVAMGLLMARYELTEQAAFAVLQRRSSHENVKLRDIASQMVAAAATARHEVGPTAV